MKLLLLALLLSSCAEYDIINSTYYCYGARHIVRYEGKTGYWCEGNFTEAPPKDLGQTID